MIAILNVGASGTGKSKLTQKLIKGFLAKGWKGVKPHDINKEYTEYYSGRFMTKNEFVEMIAERDGNDELKIRDNIIVFEEAGIFFSHAGRSDKLCEIINTKRHSNNIFIFNFISMRSVPLYILDICNYINVFKTVEARSAVERKFSDYPQIWEAYLKSLNDSNTEAMNTALLQVPIGKHH